MNFTKTIQQIKKYHYFKYKQHILIQTLLSILNSLKLVKSSKKNLFNNFLTALNNSQDGKINGVFLLLQLKEPVSMKKFKAILSIMILIIIQLYKKLLWILVMLSKSVGIVSVSERIGGNKIKRKNFGCQLKDMSEERDLSMLKNIQVLSIEKWLNIYN